MQTFRKILIGLLVAAAVFAPLSIAVTMAQTTSHSNIVRIANEPTPTALPPQGPCHGGNC